MTKKVTLSVPDSLFQEMQKWKDSLNFSRIFQEEILKRIQKKEDYENLKKDKKDKKKGGVKMEKVIERLKKERAKAEEDFFEDGKKDGYAAATHMDYSDLQYALTFEPLRDIFNANPGIFSSDPTRDDAFGEYFAEALNGNDNIYIGWEETGGSNVIPNENYRNWEAGFIQGIVDFWEEVKDEI